MAISFWGTAGKKKDSGKDGSHGGGSNPDDQSYRHHIGEPEDPEEKKKHWGSAEGNVSDYELEHGLHTTLLGKLNRRKAAIVEEAAKGSTNELGGQRGMNKGELDNMMKALGEDAIKLGLDRKRDLPIIRNAFESRL
ncbi:MAG: hypothetical protein IPJ68_01255 [Candidatus Moraniibacteriota bacterium]|nr:MAG: hypothetical protein IPJ68_01255 [Candidatus Moranbacteria bacterium]